jgi:TolB protein
MATPQIWQIEYPSGARTRVTNDLNSYAGTSLAADAQSLATVQTETVAHLYVLDAPGSEPRRLTSGSGRADGPNGIAWLPDGRIVYSSTASGLPQLWIAKADGSDARQITSMPGPASSPSSAPDGQWIYFGSFAKEGSAIFRVSPDGSGLKQLTTDGDSTIPLVSPDGKTVYVTSNRSGTPHLMKMPAEGGTPQQVFDKFFRAATISFDGKRLLGATWNDERRRVEIAVLDLASLKLEPLDAGNALFLPDGSFAVARRVQGKSMLFAEQPGRPRKTLMAGDERFIMNGAVAADGRIAFARGTQTSDVVLIKAKW